MTADSSIIILCNNSDFEKLGHLQAYYEKIGFEEIATIAVGEWSRSELAKLRLLEGFIYLGRCASADKSQKLISKIKASWISISASNEIFVFPYQSLSKLIATMGKMGLKHLRSSDIELNKNARRALIFHRTMLEKFNLVDGKFLEAGRYKLHAGPICGESLSLTEISAVEISKIYQKAKKSGAVVEPTAAQLRNFAKSFHPIEMNGGTKRKNNSTIRKNLPKRLRIGLVTFELMGATKCGGIGTAMSAIAELLARAGHKVEVIFCPFHGSQEIDKAIIAKWSEIGVAVNYFPRFWEGVHYPNHEDFSFRLAEYIQKCGKFDVLHFHDSAGYAAIPLLQRASGIAFQNTKIIVTAHGPSRWHRAANALSWNRDEAYQHHFEEITFRLADILVSPSIYMREWILENYRGSQKSIVVPNALPIASRSYAKNNIREKIRVKRIVFFGRIEVRKGIEIFLDSIQDAIKRGLKNVEILILGNFGEGISREWIYYKTKNWPINVFIEDEKGHEEALRILHDVESLVVIPSQTDNSPYTVYECLEGAIPVLASSTGGISELFAAKDREEFLFEANDIKALSNRILAAVKHGIKPAKLSFELETVDEILLDLHSADYKKIKSQARLPKREGNKVTEFKIYLDDYKNEDFSDISVSIYDRSIDKPVRKTAQRKKKPVQIGAGIHAAFELEMLAQKQNCGFILINPHKFAITDKQIKQARNLIFETRADAVCFSASVIGRVSGKKTPLIATAGPNEIIPFQNTFGYGPVLMRKSAIKDLTSILSNKWRPLDFSFLSLNHLISGGGVVYGLPSIDRKISERDVPPGILGPAEHLTEKLIGAWAKTDIFNLLGFIRLSSNRVKESRFSNLAFLRIDDDGITYHAEQHVQDSAFSKLFATPDDSRTKAGGSGSLANNDPSGKSNAAIVFKKNDDGKNITAEKLIEELDGLKAAENLAYNFRITPSINPPLISVMVCTHKRPKEFSRLIDSLKSQIDGKNLRELIVYNDGSHNQDYQKILEPNSNWIRYIQGEKCINIANARNEVARYATGEFLVYIDDDCVAPEWWLDWLEAKVKASPMLEVIAGTTVALDESNKGINTRAQNIFEMIPRPVLFGDDIVVFVTANLAISRSLFLRLGGFSTRDSFSGAGEDTELAFRCVDAGVQIEFDPNWIVKHEVGEPLIKRIKRYYRYGTSHEWLYAHENCQAFVESIFDKATEKSFIAGMKEEWKSALQQVRQNGTKGTSSYVIAANRVLSAASFNLGVRKAFRKFRQHGD